jgi:hypothetical protein
LWPQSDQISLKGSYPESAFQSLIKGIDEGTSPSLFVTITRITDVATDMQAVQAFLA